MEIQPMVLVLSELIGHYYSSCGVKGCKRCWRLKWMMDEVGERLMIDMKEEVEIRGQEIIEEILATQV